MKNIIVWSVVLLLGSTVSGLAQQTGRDALDAFLSSFQIDGLNVVYGSAEEDGDGLIINDFVITYSSTFSFEGEGDQPFSITIRLDMTAPEIIATKLRHDAGGLAADRFDFIDVMEQGGTVLVDGRPLVEFRAETHNYRVSGMVWPHLPQFPIGLKGKVREWIDWFRMIEGFRVDVATADFVTGTFSVTEEPGVEGGFSSGVEYKDFRMEGLRDGRVALYSLGPMLQETRYQLEGAPYAEIAIVESTLVKNLNAMALFELFEPKPTGTADRVELVESVEARGYRTESGLFEYVIDRIAYENASIQAPESDFVAIAEQLVDKLDPDAPTIINAVLDLYRAFSIGAIVMDGFKMDIAIEGQQGFGKINGFAIRDLSSDGLGEMILKGVDFDGGENGSFKLDRFAISEVEFPPYGPIRAFASDESAWENPDPLETARIFMPLSFAMEVKDIFLASPELPGDVKLDRYLLEMRTELPPVPTHFVFTTEGLEFPVSMIDEAEARAVFEAAGIDVLRLSDEIRLSWDEASQDLVIENIMIDLGQVGRVTARARFGGVPRSVLENPRQAQALMFTLNIKSVELELENDGGVQSALALHAQMIGSGEDALKQQLLLQLGAMLGQVGNDAFTRQVSAAAEAFLDNPQNLSIRVAPDAPVPVAQIMSDAMAAPDALPERLGITVEANR